MNAIQKYFLYKKMINPGPKTSQKNEWVSDHSLTRIDWNFNDGDRTYAVASYCLKAVESIPRDRDFYSAFVFLDGERVAVLTNQRRAQKLYNMAQSVMIQKKTR